MKAIYKHHVGFEHLNAIHPSFNSAYSAQNKHTASFLQVPHNNYEMEDTSTKKYPNNKYYQFNDEDSSGRKYLK